MGMKPRESPIDLGPPNRCLCCGDTVSGDVHNRLTSICRECEQGTCIKEQLEELRTRVHDLRRELKEAQDTRERLFKGQYSLTHARKTT